MMPREEGEKKTLFLNKESRYICWAARDAYWECQDKHTNGSGGFCDTLRKAFQEKCPSTWVKHFDRKKKYMEFKEKVKDGYEPLEQDDVKS